MLVGSDLWVVGGFGVGAMWGTDQDVLTAYIQSDGSVGRWFDAGALPTQRASHVVFALSGYIYVIGGGGQPIYTALPGVGL